jgi:hypothetical protein
MRTIIATALAAALLTSCSSKSGSGNSSAGAAAGGQETQEPANLTESQTTMAIPVTPSSPTPIGAVPSSFRGRWGMVASDCSPGGGASAADGLLTVSADRLSVGGADGAPSAIRQLTPQALVLDLPAHTPGKSGSEPTRLTLQDGGRALIRQATDAHGKLRAYTYQRCPA